jgi:hypothetical protein
MSLETEIFLFEIGTVSFKAGKMSLETERFLFEIGIFLL